MSSAPPSTSTSPSTSRSQPLTVERIVDAAYRIVQRDGLGALSMRKLGAALDVDAMAVYHHVANKQALLALVTARAMSEATPPPEPSAPWRARIEQWALGYWDVVVSHRDLTLAGLADQTIAAGGLASTETLSAAVSDSGLPADLVESTTYLIVDAVHGSALGAAAADREHADRESLRAAFADGLGVVLDGIASRTPQGNSDTTGG